jgi:hypothetical protein
MFPTADAGKLIWGMLAGAWTLFILLRFAYELTGAKDSRMPSETQRSGGQK